MNPPIQRLGERSRDAYAGHLRRLPPDDVRLRFGAPLGASAIDAYVARIDFDVDAVFALHGDELDLSGAAHMGVTGDGVAELGVSVLPGHRGRGVGSALFARAFDHARNRRIRRLWMHCLAENATMMRIARRAGMAIVVDAGEADAWLSLPPPDPASVASEFAADQVALIDYALKSQNASLARVADAVRGGGG
jgi:GNAT superfamily N-acetyltransferase